MEDLRDIAVDWAVLNGLVMAQNHANIAADRTVSHAPFSLVPARIPRTCFDSAVKLQPLFNALVHAVSSDAAFVKEVMDSLSTVDDFIAKCYKVYVQAVVQESPSQSITLGIHRSDYLLHMNEAASRIDIQQVELNTIASSFGCLSTKTTELHKFLYERADTAKDYNLPSNNALQGLTKGLARAWELYGSPTAVVVMVVQPGERNSFDQRWLENTLFTQYGVKMLRKSLLELQQQGKLVGSERKLILNGETEVAVAYFRAGYAPTDYPSEKEWDARLLVERSFAVKCPNITYHLVGSKKIQQILAQPKILDKFGPHRGHAELLRSCFTGLYPLDSSAEGKAAYKMALQQPERFVMKPQREGGGNNIYGIDVKAALEKLSPVERNAYILMELICPPPARGVLVRQGQIIQGDVISELGIYGVWISEGDVVHMNETVGHLLRTKVAESHEGGVAAGYSVLDSPNLV
ncbi:hypothetical protein HDU81_004789 [Chytriomyces hyalinus]|nr:hypothetical protein HDU81_004789 [Chytriomyces hyalinus]